MFIPDTARVLRFARVRCRVTRWQSGIVGNNRKLPIQFSSPGSKNEVLKPSRY